jgi:hypothetical protein
MPWQNTFPATGGAIRGPAVRRGDWHRGHELLEAVADDVATHGLNSP